jgi:hypothetical protein
VEGDPACAAGAGGVSGPLHLDLVDPEAPVLIPAGSAVIARGGKEFNAGKNTAGSEEMRIDPSPRKLKVIMFILFLCVAVFLTWPLLPHFFDSLYGKPGDPVNAAWSLKWFKETALLGRGSVFHYPYAAYPDGIKMSLPFPLVYMPLSLLLFLPRGETVLLNLVILLCITLNGYVMYLLGERLFRNRYAALGMGLIYMFCPYALTRAKYHYTLVGIFIFPLVLYTLLNLKDSPSRKNKIIYFLAMLLVLNIHPYYTCMVQFMIALLFLCYIIRVAKKGKKTFKESFAIIKDSLILTIAALIIAAILFYFQLAAANGGLEAIIRREGDLYNYAAHTWNYFLPSPHSAFFGGVSQQFIIGKVFPTNIEEYVLFLGYTNMGFALVGLVFWFLRRFSKLARNITESVQESANWLISFSIFLGIASFVFSLQPTIKVGDHTFYMPSWFIYKLFPYLRVYSRFGVLVFFSLTLISGAGLTFLGRSLRSKGTLVSCLTLTFLIVLMLAEFVEFERPMQKLYGKEPPYTDVSDLPQDAVIAEYPFVASDESYNSIFMWNSINNKVNILNGYSLGTEQEAMRLKILDLFNPETPGLLAYMGAGYVAIDKDMFEKGSEYTYHPIKIDLSELPAGIEIIEDKEKTSLLKIDATRPDNVVLYDPKCSLAYLPGMNPGLWLQFGKEWVIKIDAVKDVTVEIDFAIYSIEGNRDLEIEIDSGGIIEEEIGNAMVKISLPGIQLHKGINSIVFRTNAEQTPYNEVFGGNDSKPVSFVMSFWDIKEIREYKQ